MFKEEPYPFGPPNRPIPCVRLGKLAPKRLLGTPALGDYQEKASTWPAVKPRGWEYAVPSSALDCLGNDTAGDCVIAAMMHYAQADTANTGNPLTPTRQLALETYSALTGYDPKQTDANGDNPTDNGTCYSDALAYWRHHGIPMLDGKGNIVLHKIIGWASLDLGSLAQQRYACDIFGGTLLGIQCPVSAMRDTSNWRYDPASKIESGHGVCRVGQGSAGWHLGSWGKWIPTTNEFTLKLADEDYAVVTPAWIDSRTGQSPSGMDLNGLLTAMKGL